MKTVWCIVYIVVLTGDKVRFDKVWNLTSFCHQWKVCCQKHSWIFMSIDITLTAVRNSGHNPFNIVLFFTDIVRDDIRRCQLSQPTQWCCFRIVSDVDQELTEYINIARQCCVTIQYTTVIDKLLATRLQHYVSVLLKTSWVNNSSTSAQLI